MTEGVIQGILRGNSLSHRLRRRQLPQRGSLGFCVADSPTRVAPAKRGAGRFDALQNSRSNQLRAEKSFRLRRSFRRAPVLRVPTSFTLLDRARPVFSFSSGRKFGAPAATQRSGCGGERRKEWSRAQSSPLGGDGAGGISSDDMGGALHQPPKRE